MQDINACVVSLAQRGYGYIDIDEAKVEPVRTGFKAFVQRREAQDDHAAWALQRYGEHEFDRGLMVHEGGKKDIKSVLHYDGSLREDMVASATPLDRADYDYFEASHQLYAYLIARAAQVLGTYDQSHDTSLFGQFLHTCENDGMPYATTMLRNLWYPPVENQKGAKRHIDRGLLTIHLGDEGGYLLAHESRDSDDGERVSPPPGKALVFWGVKALWGTAGSAGPLWHSSITEPGEERFALVQFNHIGTGSYNVTDANKAHAHWHSQTV